MKGIKDFLVTKKLLDNERKSLSKNSSAHSIGLSAQKLRASEDTIFGLSTPLAGRKF